MRNIGSRPLRAAAAAALVAIAACGGGSDATGIGTTSGSLDPVAIGATATRLQAVTAQPVLSALFAQGPAGLLQSFSRGIASLPQLATHATRIAPMARATIATGISRATRGGPSRHGSFGTTPLIPDSLLGKTLVPDGLGGFTVSPSITGAPANGVRFTIRASGSTQDLGYADLTQSVTGATSTFTLDVTTTTGMVALHDVETATAGTGSDGTDSFAGYMTNGSDRVDYTINEQTASNRTVTTTSISAAALNVAVADTSVLNGATASDASISRITFGSTVVRITTPSVADSMFGGYIPSDTSSVTLNGSPFAKIVVNSTGQPSITAPNGAPLSSNDSKALVGALGIFLSLETALLAPVTVALWLLTLTSGL